MPFYVTERTILVRQVRWAPSRDAAEQQAASPTAVDCVTDALADEIRLNETVVHAVTTLPESWDGDPSQVVWTTDAIGEVADVMARLVIAGVQVFVQHVDDYYNIVVPFSAVEKAVAVADQYRQDTYPAPVETEAEAQGA